MCTPPNMSHVTCHESCVTCHMSHFIFSFLFFFLDKVVKLSGGGSVINGAYPVLFPSYFHTQTSSLNVECSKMRVSNGSLAIKFHTFVLHQAYDQHNYDSYGIHYCWQSFDAFHTDSDFVTVYCFPWR